MWRAVLAGLATAAVLAGGGAAARAADPDAIDKAVGRGVAFLKTAPAGANETSQPAGATALVGLALLECGVAPDDKAVQSAAAAVRLAGLTQNMTYSLALGILFLDLLDDPADVPLIESMTVRLLAGQNANGGWTYSCPTIGDSEVRRLMGHVKNQADPVAHRDPPPETEKPAKRTVKDLPKEIQQQLLLINQAALVRTGNAPSDNSNTQFATVALWVARRHGLPVDAALGRIDRRHRLTQNADGAWSYNPEIGAPPPPSAPGGSSATMTCAALLGLSVAQGVEADFNKENGKSAPDLTKDRALKAGLMVLGTAIGNPADKRAPGDAGGAAPQVGGRTYYFLWSLERVAVALDLDTIGGKDWYGWGAEVLLANQGSDGSWHGEYSAAVDTCFALLFLKRANLTRDLTSGLKGKMRDPGAITLKSGGVGGDALAGLKSGLESKDAKPAPDDPSRAGKPSMDPAEARVPMVPAPVVAWSETMPQPGARMARELAQAPMERRDDLLETYRDGKGVMYTEALAGAIPQLTGEARRQARDALADRLTRMKAETLGRYFQDPDAEIRRAAALAAAQRDAKTLIPDLIPLLNDAEPSVARAAHAALKDLTGETLGPTADEWKAWWKKQEGK